MAAQNSNAFNEVIRNRINMESWEILSRVHLAIALAPFEKSMQLRKLIDLKGLLQSFTKSVI